jgi:signal transduction histidine kinase/DNA-binding response OmpR family regulator
LRASEARAVKIVAGEPAITKAATEICAFFSESLNAPAAGFFSLSEGGPRFEGGVGIPSDVQALHPGTINEIASRAGDIKQIEVPPDYFYISSGLGRAQPRYLTFIPIESRPGERAAIVELALFERLSADKLAWLRVMRAALGPGIGSALSRRQLNDLLEETQVQAEELQVQQEELRATNEEIAAKATELERANRYKSDFLSRMSHELRTPLNSLLTLATLLGENREGTLTPRQLEFARTIHSSGEDLLSLINDVLDFSRLEAGKITPHSEVFSLHDLVERVSKGFKSIAEAKGLAFEVRFAEGSADQVNGDPRLIQQILRNFVSNAVKFTDHGRVSVLVGTSPRDPHFVRLTVSDTGIGIPEEKRSAIFEAFEQADTSTSRRYGGSGLGLTIARDFTRVLGGDVGVRSQEGEGSEFWADLPLPVASLTAHAAPKADHVDRLTQKILLAEGDPSLRALMTATAEARGYNVIEAEDTQQVLRILETETPSAILIDTRFDSGTGPRLREKIRAIKRLDAIPVQLIGEVTESNAETEIQNATIANPARPESVLSALKQVARSQIKKLKRLLIVESLGQKNSSTQPLESLLRNENVELHTASTAAEATKAMTSQDFDCVILDLALPDRSGFDLLQSFATEQPEKLPPVIVYTSRAIGKDEEERLRRYAESIIIKGPKSPERLLDEVSLFLHRVETALPSEKRTSLERQRQRERTFEGRSILVADDDLRSVFTIVSLLEAKGFKVLIARDGEEALAKLEQRPPPDAVLMDIMMPKIDGYETIRRIRTHGDMQSIPIIALTAKTMKGEAERCFAAGANAYLAKPLDIPRLLATLNSFIQPSPESTREQGSNEEQRALRT